MFVYFKCVKLPCLAMNQNKKVYIEYVLSEYKWYKAVDASWPLWRNQSEVAGRLKKYLDFGKNSNFIILSSQSD